MNGISALTKEAWESSLASSARWGYTWGHLWTGKRASPDTELTMRALWSQSSAPRTMRNKFLWFLGHQSVVFCYSSLNGLRQWENGGPERLSNILWLHGSRWVWILSWGSLNSESEFFISMQRVSYIPNFLGPEGHSFYCILQLFFWASHMVRIQKCWNSVLDTEVGSLINIQFASWLCGF